MRKYMLDRYYRRKAEWVDKLGGVCVECGSTEDLNFDHVDPKQKTYSISKILTSGSEAKVAAEMAKCQLLCYGHHLIKTGHDYLNGVYSKTP